MLASTTYIKRLLRDKYCLHSDTIVRAATVLGKDSSSQASQVEELCNFHGKKMKILPIFKTSLRLPSPQEFRCLNRLVMAEGRRAAEEFLAENKEFKAVHSVSSAKAMLESAAAKQQEMAAA